MSVDLSGYRVILPALFVKITSPGTTYLLSDYRTNYTLNGLTYTTLGRLLGVTSSASEVRITDSEVSVTISGVPAGSVTGVLNTQFKGSPIEIQRAFFNPAGTLLPVAGNPAIKFKGLIANYGLTEEYDVAARTSTFSVTLVCQSVVSVLKNKVGGRRTNPYDELKWYPADLGLTRVPTVVNSNFQFGAPPTPKG
jgi:hypothetical protein